MEPRDVRRRRRQRRGGVGVERRARWQGGGAQDRSENCEEGGDLHGGEGCGPGSSSLRSLCVVGGAFVPVTCVGYCRRDVWHGVRVAIVGMGEATAGVVSRLRGAPFDMIRERETKRRSYRGAACVHESEAYPRDPWHSEHRGGVNLVRGCANRI